MGSSLYAFTPSQDDGEQYYALQKIKNAIRVLDERTSDLEYVTINIDSFSGGSTNEIGTTVATVNAAWTLSGSATVTSLTLTDAPDVLTTDTSYNFTGLSLTTNKTYTLAVEDAEGSTDSSSISVVFRNKRHWGVSTNTSLSSAQILGLANSEFATSYSQSRTFDATGGYYLYFAWPSSFGASPTFTVNGLEDSSWVDNTVSHTNASGYTVNYDTWRSANLLNGSGIQVVVS